MLRLSVRARRAASLGRCGWVGSARDHKRKYWWEVDDANHACNVFDAATSRRLPAMPARTSPCARVCVRISLSLSLCAPRASGRRRGSREPYWKGLGGPLWSGQETGLYSTK